MALKCLLFSCAVALTVGCHPGPVLDPGAKPPSVGGTISGRVSTTDPAIAVPDRKVTAINTADGQRYAATSASNGGYTIKLPEGTYRIEVELRPGESIQQQPDNTHINNGDLDAQRDFIIAAR